MKKISLRLLIRRFVLATSFPPFLQVYRAFYTLVIYLTIRMFRRYPSIKAVYLRRGGGKGEILPLISDLDFAVFEEEMEKKDKEELLRRYDNLARATTILDQNLEVYNEETFNKLYESNYFFQYRFMEGKKTWRLLYGEDYLAKLPSLSVEQMQGGFYTEIRTWWSLFTWRFFEDKKYNREVVTRNNVCFKTVSEILKMTLGLNHAIITFDRKEALELSKPFFDGKDRAFLEKLWTMAVSKHFRVSDEGILDETKDFLLRYLDRFYSEFRTHPYARCLMVIGQKVDCLKDEWFWSDKDRSHIRNLVSYVKEHWPDTYRGAFLAWSVYFHVDELLLLLEVNPERPPTVKEIRHLNLFHHQAHFCQRSRIKIYLLFPSAAFQITFQHLKKSWQSILLPFNNPDLFELLTKNEFALDRRGFRPPICNIWTPLIEHFVREEKKLFREALDNPLIYKLNSLDFLRTFWKAVQIVILDRSVKRRDILYPLTLPAMKRALAAEGFPLPSMLENLENAYCDEIDEKATHIGSLMPYAINYLREINLE